MTEDQFSYASLVDNPDAGHLDGCKVQMIANHGEEFMGLCRCVDGCPHVEAAASLGRELALQHGW